MEFNYLFGLPVRPVPPRADGSRELFVLGAYPSALHVRWTMPGRTGLIKAIAVDDEPEPFWTGRNQKELIGEWCRKVEFRDPAWGEVAACGQLNGSSGIWLDKHVLRPLGIERSQVWITDCLNMYCESKGAASRLASPAVMDVVAKTGITPARHRPHPSGNTIVRDALNCRDNVKRLLEEIRTARPQLAVTLGNAALRVMATLAGGNKYPQKLSHIPKTYGRALQAKIGEKSVEWIPLAHPAAPALYQDAHAAWVAARRGRGQ